MAAKRWLEADLVLASIDEVTVEGVRQRVAEKMASATGLSVARVQEALEEAMKSEGYSIGNGVVLPHTELSELDETYTCLVTVRTPLPLKSIDGKPVHLAIFILSKPDPHAHLLLLARLARLLQSRTLVDGLRRSRTNDEVIQLIDAAEMRHEATRAVEPQSSPQSQGLFVISVGGEKLVDSLLVALVELGFGEASVLEAQSLREATAREVPLFAGFRDLFGDPGGQRILLLEAELARSEDVIGTVRKVAEEHKARDARVAVVPLHVRWQAPRASEEPSAPEH